MYIFIFVRYMCAEMIVASRMPRFKTTKNHMVRNTEVHTLHRLINWLTAQIFENDRDIY